MAAPGLDAGQGGHLADVPGNDGERLFARAAASDQADLEALLERAAQHGTPVAYVPGLVMPRAAGLYPGEAKTGRRDACALADTGRARRKQVHCLDVGLAADQTRLASRLRGALASICPALERAVGGRLRQAGVRDLLTRYPALTARGQPVAHRADRQGALAPDRRQGHHRHRHCAGRPGRHRPC